MKIREERIVAETPWMSFRERIFEDREGHEKSWTYVERTNRQHAAVIIPTTVSTGTLVLVAQTRIPLGGRVLEFPAGLIEPGEDPGDAALRELEEETGYRGMLISVGPATASSPGVTNELVHLVQVRAEEHPSREVAHEPSEEIEVLRFPPAEISRIYEYARDESVVLDARLAAYLDSMILCNSSRDRIV